MGMNKGDKVLILDTSCTFQGDCRTFASNGNTCVGLVGTIDILSDDESHVKFDNKRGGCSAYRKPGCLELWVTHI